MINPYVVLLIDSCFLFGLGWMFPTVALLRLKHYCFRIFASTDEFIGELLCWQAVAGIITFAIFVSTYFISFKTFETMIQIYSVVWFFNLLVVVIFYVHDAFFG